MADKSIGALPAALSVNDSSLIPVEQQGTAMRMTGAQFKLFARDSVRTYADNAAASARAAAQSEADAEAFAKRAETARNSIMVDERKLAEAVEDASNSADSAADSASDASDSAVLAESWAAGGTGTRPGENTNNAKYWANRAEAEADRATVPALEGVYNVVIQDRETGQKYALVIKNGALHILGVADTFAATDVTFIDVETGASCILAARSGRLVIMEV